MTIEPVRRERLRALLAQRGLAPLKRHGQHFLLDDNLLAAIVRDAGVGASDVVLEIGPGPGLLTRHLLGTGCRVVAFEIDRGMAAVAEGLLPAAARPRLRWIEGDVLAGPGGLHAELDRVLGEVSGLVANLPYGIAGPLLGRLLDHEALPGRMVVMVQREMADRLLAEPGSRDYGPLAVRAGLSCRGERCRRVPAAAFWPAPRVESAVVRLRRRTDRPPAEARRALARFLPLAFHGRRKTLPNAVAEASGLTARDVVARLGVAENREKIRAEAMGRLDLLDLALRWEGPRSGERDRPEDG